MIKIYTDLFGILKLLLFGPQDHKGICLPEAPDSNVLLVHDQHAVQIPLTRRPGSAADRELVARLSQAAASAKRAVIAS